MCEREERCGCGRDNDCDCKDRNDICEALRRAKKCAAQAECALKEVKGAIREIERELKKPRCQCQCVRIDPIC